MNHKYTHKEHLKHYKQIEHLFKNGVWCTKYPLKIIYCPSKELDFPHKVGVSVSKKIFKHATDRNYIKRLLRECFRLNKNNLYELFSPPHLLMIIYVGKDIISYQKLEKIYLELLNKVRESR